MTNAYILVTDQCMHNSRDLVLLQRNDSNGSNTFHPSESQNHDLRDLTSQIRNDSSNNTFHSSEGQIQDLSPFHSYNYYNFPFLPFMCCIISLNKTHYCNYVHHSENGRPNRTVTGAGASISFAYKTRKNITSY
ncbi:hypothetical protein ACJW31_09G144300 [Castanea mollissima]